jgi:hypothetical protein
MRKLSSDAEVGLDGGRSVDVHDDKSPGAVGGLLMFDRVAWVVSEVRENPDGIRTVVCET